MGPIVSFLVALAGSQQGGHAAYISAAVRLSQHSLLYVSREERPRKEFPLQIVRAICQVRAINARNEGAPLRVGVRVPKGVVTTYFAEKSDYRIGIR